MDVNVQGLEDKDYDARRLKRTDFNSIINQLRAIPYEKSRFCVPLCRLVVLPLVRPILEGDVQLLETEFSNGYREGDRVLYVSIAKNDGSSLDVTDETVSSWDQHWQRANHRFEKELDKDKDLHKFKGKMFYVWEGNHRVTAWLRHIERHHSDEERWHYSVDCIFLDPKGSVGVLLDAMNDVNRSVTIIIPQHFI